MDHLVGSALALTVSLFAHLIGFDRDRAFYPVVLIVIASYYPLFAVTGGSVSALGPELLVVALFAGLAVWGFRRSLWWVVAGLLLHAGLDAWHGRFVLNPGVPEVWPDFCLAYDLVAAACLSALLASRRLRTT